MSCVISDLYQGRDDHAASQFNWVPWAIRLPQVIALCKSFWPSSTQYTILNRIEAGSNEVILVRMWSPIIPLDSTAIAIRIPFQSIDAGEFSKEQLEQYMQGTLDVSGFETSVLWRQTIDSVAMLQHVTEVIAEIETKSSFRIKVPKLIAYDTTCKNVLQAEFMVIELIDGTDVDEILELPELQGDSEGTRRRLATEVGEIMNQLRQIKSPYAGLIRASTSRPWPTTVGPQDPMPKIDIRIVPFGGDWDYEVDRYLSGEVVDGISEEFIASGGLTSDPPNLSLKDIVSRAWDRRLYQTGLFSPQDDYTSGQWTTLKQMSLDCVEQGVLDTGDISLFHGDLFPRNIMVDIHASQVILGVLDWDEVMYAPTVISAALPTWLWTNRVLEEDQEEEGDEDDDVVARDTSEDETYEQAIAIPDDPDLVEVRRVYEIIVGKEFVASGCSERDIQFRQLVAFARVKQWAYWWNDVADTMIDGYRAKNQPDSDEEEDQDEEGDHDSEGDQDKEEDEGIESELEQPGDREDETLYFDCVEFQGR